MIFTQGTKEKALLLYPAFALTILDLYELMYEKTGKTLGLYQGFRSFGAQADLFNQGRITKGPIVTDAQPGFSTHNYGLGADSVFEDGTDGFKNEPWILFGQLASSLGLENGDLFNGICDKDHVECLYGLEVKDLLIQWKQNGTTAVFAKLDFVRGVAPYDNWHNTLIKVRARLVN